jgi:hypothetical protein
MLARLRVWLRGHCVTLSEWEDEDDGDGSDVSGSESDAGAGEGSGDEGDAPHDMDDDVRGMRSAANGRPGIYY